jgi:hypothetical protein
MWLVGQVAAVSRPQETAGGDEDDDKAADHLHMRMRGCRSTAALQEEQEHQQKQQH